MESRESGRCSSIDQQIERSKSHWSELTEFDSTDDDEDIEADNREVFKSLQMHPKWGSFFCTYYGDGGIHDHGELVVGEKFAEGGQAELYCDQVTSYNPHWNAYNLEEGNEFVVKAFKKGTPLRQLQSQLPQGLFQHHAENLENWLSPKPKRIPRYFCEVMCGTLLEDDRFAFVMVRQHFDLRSLIDRMLERSHGHGPFKKAVAEGIMYRIALGMDWLHRHNIVHRDLKASNVLVNQSPDGQYACAVADYECSNSVVGTGFWRAPDILKACKDRDVSHRPELFSTAIDIYGYGMTGYEILTGKLPFEYHPVSDKQLLTDLVINGLRPEVPDFVDAWAHDLLISCWQSNPASRPPVEEILSFIEANSNYLRGEWQNHIGG